MSYEPPEWVCEYRSHHRYNDFGEPVDQYGDTEEQAEIREARRAHPSRSVG